MSDGMDGRDVVEFGLGCGNVARDGNGSMCRGVSWTSLTLWREKWGECLEGSF